MIKGLIFDLDGVLVSTDELHYNAWRKLAQDLGIENYNKEDNEKQRGVSRMDSLEVVLQKGQKIYSNTEKVALADQKNNYYLKMLEDLNTDAVLGGAVESLVKMKEKGLIIGVGSASKNAIMILEKTGLAGYIDKVSCGLDITRSKPDPEVFLIAAKKMNLEPEECLVIEDAKSGIMAAKAANMKTLGVGPYYKELGADFESETLYLDWNAMFNKIDHENV